MCEPCVSPHALPLWLWLRLLLLLLLLRRRRRCRRRPACVSGANEKGAFIAGVICVRPRPCVCVRRAKGLSHCFGIHPCADGPALAPSRSLARPSSVCSGHKRWEGVQKPLLADARRARIWPFTTMYGFGFPEQMKCYGRGGCSCVCVCVYVMRRMIPAGRKVTNHNREWDICGRHPGGYSV